MFGYRLDGFHFVDVEQKQAFTPMNGYAFPDKAANTLHLLRQGRPAGKDLMAWMRECLSEDAGE